MHNVGRNLNGSLALGLLWYVLWDINNEDNLNKEPNQNIHSFRMPMLLHIYDQHCLSQNVFTEISDQKSNLLIQVL